MKSRLYAAGVLVLVMAAGAAASGLNARGVADGPEAWDREKAAQYLDDRMDLWLEKATELKTGEGKTSCVSCHAMVPYLLARPVLRTAMHMSNPTPQEVKLLDEVRQRVETYASNDALYDHQGKQSRGTEVVLNALILATDDARQNLRRPSEPTRKAFRRLWETQRPDGGWDWLDFALEPDESADAQYYGAALAAIALGTAPGLVGSQEEGAASHAIPLRAFLNSNYAPQSLYNRAWMLLASTRLAGLLSAEQREKLVAELQGRQNDDGGWSLYRLGPWRWSKTTPPFAPGGNANVSLLAASDGYATGLIVYALRQAGVPRDGLALRKGTDWLKANQKDIQVGQQRWKCWRSLSLNHDRENGGARGEPWKRMMMSDAATAFAVLALLPSD